MEIKQYLSDILLTVLLSWKAILWRLRDFHDTGRGSSYILCNLWSEVATSIGTNILLCSLTG